MATELKEQLIDYLGTVSKNNGMPLNAKNELASAIDLLKSKRITFPSPEDSALQTAQMVYELVDNFFRRYPSIMSTVERIDQEEKCFQVFIQNSGLLRTDNKLKGKR